MTIVIMFHSYSGVTRGIADTIRTACGGDLVEVSPRERYSSVTAYTVGCLRAIREEPDPIEPERIDVSGYDLIVVGTPVWAWKATPAINGAIRALYGCEGKDAVVFATCGAQSRDTLPIMTRALEARGVRVVGGMTLNRKEIRDGRKVTDLIACITRAMGKDVPDQ